MAEYIEKAAILTKCEEMWNAADETTQTGVDTINAIDRITDYIESLPATDVQPVDRWISCKDKMPEEYKTVLVYEKDYGVMIGELEKKFFDTQYFIARKSGLILRTTEVTHWQPLPEPPKQ